MSYHAHLQALDCFLFDHRHLWQPEPFKTVRPAWCETEPQLTQALLDLDEGSLELYEADSEALITLISTYIPSLSLIPSLIRLPVSREKRHDKINPRFYAGVPGRKWTQINALYQRMERPQGTITEWCGGKGYLGRLLSSRWQQKVTTLEYDQQLVEAGSRLAHKQQVDQLFRQVDVLRDPVSSHLHQSHTIALHACGDLHRKLIRDIIATSAPAFTIIPCCYHLGENSAYVPFSGGLQLHISRETLRLAVNETVTAHHNEINNRDRDMAWKLGFQQLWQREHGNTVYHPFNPVPKTWLNEGFQGYCRKLAARENLTVPTDLNWSKLEQLGYQRRHDVKRLQLLRHGFKRVLELWLIMDMAHYLEASNYNVHISTFCKREITPRNILIEGRLSN